MQFRFQLQKWILPLIVFPVLASGYIFFSNTKGHIQELQYSIMKLRLEQFLKQCRDEQDILKRAGIVHVDYFVNSAKNRMIRKAKNLKIPDGFMVIYDKSKNLIHAPKQRLFRSNRELLETIKNSRNSFFEYRYLGTGYISFYRDFNDWNWLVIISVDKAMVLQAVSQSAQFSVLVLFIIVLFSLFALNLIAKKITKPVFLLKETAERLSGGDFSVQINLKNRGEFSILGDSFNLMAKKVNTMIKEREALLADLKEKNKSLSEEIFQRKEVEKELNKAKSYLNNIINSMPSALVGIDDEGRITELNNEGESLFQLKIEEIKGQNFENIFPQFKEFIDKIKSRVREKEVFEEPKIPFFSEGNQVYFNLTAYPLLTNGVKGSVIRIDDISNRVRFEEMMVQNEKMLSVGGLAAGMAHEINNPLGIILQSVQNLRRRLDSKLSANKKVAEELGLDLLLVDSFVQKRKIADYLDYIREAGERASKIVRSMLQFTRQKSTSDKQAGNINEILKTSVDLVAKGFSLEKGYDFKQVQVEYQLDSDLPFILCFPSELEQVFINLFKNAAQAMQEAGQEKPKIFISSLKKMGFVQIEVRDNGPGMSKEVQRRIFDPFYTTKKVGEGTGLGLSVSFFIVAEHHGGQLTVKSKPGEGTTFIIKLPVIKTESRL